MKPIQLVALGSFIATFACGGSAVDPGDADSGTGGGTGGSSASGGTGGSSASGGTGGSSASGGTGGSSASGGTGGSSGGSGGTAGAAGAAWDACELTSECVIRSESCCGSCGAATRGDVTALHVDFVAAYANNVCAGQGCPACYQPTDPTLLAECNGGLCVVVDLLQHPVTQCSSASDCRIRTKDCCECGGGMGQESLIAINAGQGVAYSALACDPDTACAECAPEYPPEVEADCQNGRCVAVW